MMRRNTGLIMAVLLVLLMTACSGGQSVDAAGTWVHDKNKLILNEDGTGVFISAAKLSSNSGEEKQIYQTQEVTWEQSKSEVTINHGDIEVKLKATQGDEGDTLSSDKITYTRYDPAKDPIVGEYKLMIALGFSGNYIDATESISFKEDETFELVADGISYSGTWKASGQVDNSIDVSRIGYDMMQQGKTLSTAWYTSKESGNGYEIIVPLQNGSSGMYLFYSKQ